MSAKISEEPLVASVTGAEALPVVAAGANAKMTTEQIKNYVFQNLASLPTTLPGTPGQLWNNGGVVCIS